MDAVTILLTGAGGSASANVVDALRRSGNPYRIVGVDASPLMLQLSQADVLGLVPRVTDPGYGARLNSLITDHDVSLVHAQPDPEVLTIGELRDEIRAATYLPRQEVLWLAADKTACAQRLADRGVPVPESVPLDSLENAGPRIHELLQRHERVWIRARRGAGSRASLPVRTAEQATAWMAWWIAERGLAATDFMASEFLPGREFAYQSVWQDGELVAGQARERVAYLYGHLTPSGQTSTPSVARTVSVPAVDDAAIAAVRALDAEPHGAYCVDLKESASGRPCVTEINAGRFFTTSNFFAHAGLNMPDLVVRCALGERPARRPSSPLPPDLYWIRMVDMGYRLVSGDDLERFAATHH